MTSHDEVDVGYGIEVGDRLRAIRKQKRMSLNEVEERSGGEFKASVVGAYERGERTVSVLRLDRLARFYRVPVDQLLPQRPGETLGDQDGGRPRKLVIDLAALSELSGAPFDMLMRFLRMIQVQRQDFNGRVLTVRADDRRAIAAMLGIPADQVDLRLDALGLVFHRD